MKARLLIILFAVIAPYGQACAEPSATPHRNHFKPLGIQLGSFLFHPTVALEESYDDNIYKTPTNEKADFKTAFKPGLKLISNWDLHQVEFMAEGDLTYYADNNDESYKDYKLTAKGRYDLDYETYFTSELRYDSKHEDRDSPDDAGGDTPTKFNVTQVKIGFTRALNKLQLFIEGRLKDIDYENNTRRGTLINNNFRDRMHKEADLKLAYVMTPAAKAFMRGIVDRRDYDASSLMDRSSRGYRLQAGVDFDITGKLRGEIHAGHISRDYLTAFKDINTVDYGGALIWNMTALTTLRAGLDRNVIETTQAGVSGYVRNDWYLETEHGLTDNILLSGMLGFADDDFIGNGREDRTYKSGLQMTYLPARNIESYLRYRYASRDSNVNRALYDNHVISAGLSYRF